MDSEKPPYSQLSEIFKDKGETYSKWLQSIGETIGKSEAEAVFQKMMSWSGSLDVDTLRRLVELSNNSKTNASIEVGNARRELREFFQDRREMYQKEDFRLILYGSLEYGDPVNMDADLLAVRRQSIPRNLTKSLLDISDDLDEYWAEQQYQGGLRRGAHITSFALDEVAEIFEKENVSGEELYLPLLSLSVVISGVPLYEEDIAWHNNIRQEALKIAESEPFIGSSVDCQLEDVLNTREERSSSEA